MSERISKAEAWRCEHAQKAAQAREFREGAVLALGALASLGADAFP